MRILAGSSLPDSDARARAVLDATADAVVLFAPDGAVLARNALSRELLGPRDRRLRLDTPDSVEGWHDAEDRPLEPDEHPAVLARSAPGPVTQMLSIRRPDGAWRWVRAGACTVMDADGSGEVVLTLSDITELRTAHSDLVRCDEELRRIATVTSHDLGVPLAALRRSLAAMSAGAVTAAAAEELRDAQAAVEHMGETIGAMLSYADVDREVVEDDAVDLAAIAGEIVTLLRRRIEEAGATVEVGALPRVTGSQVLLRQLLQNLVSNAIGHHPGPAPHVAIRSERRGSAEVIIVEDDGNGIPDCQRDAVFGLFARGCSSADGHGIGLSAAKRIVERHGGQIWIEDAVPHGARFCMTL